MLVTNNWIFDRKWFELLAIRNGLRDSIYQLSCITKTSISKELVSVSEIPTCNITSNHRTDDIALHEQLSLAVDIQGYHCSAAFNFSLQTGTVAELLSNVVRGATTSLDVTESHLGAVRLIFSCHTQQWNLTCGGVTKLIKSEWFSVTSATRLLRLNFLWKL